MMARPKGFIDWIPGESEQSVSNQETVLLMLKTGKIIEVEVVVSGCTSPFNARYTKQVIRFRNKTPTNLISSLKTTDILYYKRQADHIALIV